MRHIYSNLQATIRDAGLPESVYEKLIGLLKGNEDEIPVFRVLRLVNLLNWLRSGQFLNLSSIRKKELLDNFFELYRYKRKKVVTQICCLVFEERLPDKNSAILLPEDMMKAMVRFGNMERVDSVKEMIWGFLIKNENKVLTLISPEQLIFGLWLENPIIRNTIIKSLFHHFDPESVLTALKKHIFMTGKEIPAEVLKRLIWMAEEEEGLKQKKHLLTDIIRDPYVGEEDIERVWSDYLRGLDRYELVRAFTSDSGRFDWIEDLKKGISRQTSFNFKYSKKTSCSEKPFYNRLRAIRNQIASYDLNSFEASLD